MDHAQLILYNTPDGQSSVVLLAREGQVWLTQAQMAELFGTSKQNISVHISNIIKDKELSADSVVKDYLTTAADGRNYNVNYYSLEMILAVGFRVRGARGTQFRQWAGANLAEYLVKGFLIDDQRLKNPDGRPDHFDELLARIRDIRASEKRFYQKIRDLFRLSSDYDPSDKATQMFFAETQNKLLYAVTKQTAAEIVVDRADANDSNMGLRSWKGERVRKQDITTAKNYLTAAELDKLNRLVVIFLETAELRVQERSDLTMGYWRTNVDRVLLLNEQEILTGNGSVSNAQMESAALKIYALFDTQRKQKELVDADNEDMEKMRELEGQVKGRQLH